MKEYKDVLFYKIIRPLVKAFMYIVFRPTIIGREFIPENGRVILAGNHTNNLDSLLLMSCTKRNIHFLAKSELFKGPKKIIFNNLGLIPVNRKIKDKSVIPAAKEYLKNELVVGIFPEGTTEKGCGYLLPFKTGAVRLSNETDTIIVPFKIINNYKIFRKSVKIIFSEGLKATENVEKSNEILYNIINDIKDSDK